ncbi:MAG: alpha/beta fold hydrolase [Acetatifactor sp.]|nr:alpha/beta fold hydrolase [Acetatifactor sp.]
MRLICLPYAGGNSIFFTKWRKVFGNEIEVVSVEYAGHGRRICEEFTDSYQDTLEDVFSQVEKLITSEYAIFGHSMGAVYAYEVVKRLEKKGLRMPAAVIVSGSRAPYENNERLLHKMDKDVFMQELFKMGGLSGEIFENRELLDLVYTVSFNDIKNLEEYRSEHFEKTPEKIRTQMIVLYGEEDEEFSGNDICRWQDYCLRKNIVKGFKGGHFFIDKEREDVCDFLRRKILFY